MSLRTPTLHVVMGSRGPMVKESDLQPKGHGFESKYWQELEKGFCTALSSILNSPN